MDHQILPSPISTKVLVDRFVKLSNKIMLTITGMLTTLLERTIIIEFGQPKFKSMTDKIIDITNDMAQTRMDIDKLKKLIKPMVRGGVQQNEICNIMEILKVSTQAFAKIIRNNIDNINSNGSYHLSHSKNPNDSCEV